MMMGNLVTFPKDSALNILIQSLDWETFEQSCAWQLFLDHNIALETNLQHLSSTSNTRSTRGPVLPSVSSPEREAQRGNCNECAEPALPPPQPVHYQHPVTWVHEAGELLAHHIKPLLIKINTSHARGGVRGAPAAGWACGSGADPEALGQHGSQPDQHQMELS